MMSVVDGKGESLWSSGAAGISPTIPALYMVHQLEIFQCVDLLSAPPVPLHVLISNISLF